MSVESYAEALIELGGEAACITNHGDLNDYDRLVRLSPADMIIIPGVEISSPDGDFLIFSADEDFLRTLQPAQHLPARDERPAGTAVVWAHPFGGDPGGATATEDYLERIATQVDGVEIHNGNWPDEKASRKARRLASQYRLAELAGSDAHRRENLFKCWTEVAELKGSQDLVDAIMTRSTQGLCRQE